MLKKIREWLGCGGKEQIIQPVAETPTVAESPPAQWSVFLQPPIRYLGEYPTLSGRLAFVGHAKYSAICGLNTNRGEFHFRFVSAHSDKFSMAAHKIRSELIDRLGTDNLDISVASAYPELRVA